ncbi:MAG: dihydrodipicolinate synthase family protein [Fuerstiella sp.]|nr:dihydrodipicolinate synthase family protein [Fuerstiella sp.]
MSSETLFAPALTSVPAMIPGRKITGISAVLLPFLEGTAVDWDSFETHVSRTLDAGLIPAVNMDTGYINLIDAATQQEVLQRTQQLASGRRFVAGAFVSDQPESSFDVGGYRHQTDLIHQHGGTPVVFPSYGLTQQSDEAIIDAYRQIASGCDRFIGFELSTAFAPFGKIYSLNVYRELLLISQCEGAKHSSLQRIPEWERLQLRDKVRPDFKVFTGNDLAIDMVKYGSDYLLGLSSFAPDLFALRDSWWESGDCRFYELNDALQYLGEFTFRSPVPAYRHSCAQFLKLRGHITDSEPPKGAPSRPVGDLETLQKLQTRLRDVSSR